jgi:hypothetical protein
MAAKTEAQRKRDERDRYRAQGRVAVMYWIHPADRQALHRYVDRMNQKRFKQRGD